MIRPGAVGDIKVGESASALLQHGYIRAAAADASCGVHWVTSRELTKLGIDLDFTLGNPDDLDQVIIHTVGRPERPGAGVRDEEGLTAGATVDQVRAQHPDAVRGTYNEEGGGLNTWTTFGPDGALSFGYSSEGRPGQGAVLYLTRGSDSNTFQPPALGC